MHVTWSVREELPNLRGPKPMRVIRAAFRKGKDRFGFKLVHFSVQKAHVHLVCEAQDARSLARGLQGLAVRVAKGLNRALGRKGKVFSDRYHSRILKSPAEVRWALGYVLNNTRRHNAHGSSPDGSSHAQRLVPRRYPRRWLDVACSSARYLDGFALGAKPLAFTEPDDSSPVVAPSRWLLKVGWRRAGGRIPTDHVPAARGAAEPRAG